MGRTKGDFYTLMYQTEALAWDENPYSNCVKELQHRVSNLAFLGHLVAAKALNKHTVHAIMRVIWNFAEELLIEDL